MTGRIVYWLNFLGIIGIITLILLASLFEFLFHELPCPLCILQRIGLLLISIGFLLNIKFGVRASHYAIVILATLYTMIVSGRQILLHIVPGSGAYGDPLLGLHLYTWLFIFGFGCLLWIAICLFFDKQFESLSLITYHDKLLRFMHYFSVIGLLLVIGINIISVFLECGFAQCPANPQQYRF